MKHAIPLYFRVLILLSAIGLSLGGCGGDDDDASADDSADDSAADDDNDDDAGDDSVDDDVSDDDAGDDDATDDDTGDDDTFSWDEVDCFDEGGLADDVQICHFYGTDFVGKAADDPGDELTDEIFPDGFTYVENEDWDSVIQGTDLGINVQVGGTTYYAFGDTHPIHDKGSDGPLLGVPWGWDADGDLQLDNLAGNADGAPAYDSITPLVAFDDDTATLLLNQHERDFMFPGGSPSGTEVGFFVPTGMTAGGTDTLYYWYGKYINNANCDQSHLVAYDIPSDTWSYVSPFADRKFIQIAAVPVSRDITQDPAVCPLPWTEDHEKGYLIYGSGRPVANSVTYADADPQGPCRLPSDPGYRVSRLYLGYINRADMDATNVPSKMQYFSGPGGGCWTQGDVDAAQPILGEETFGEFSVTRVPDTGYLMLSHSFMDAEAEAWLQDHPEYEHHFVGEFQVRLADADTPYLWSDPLSSASYGYGDYVIEPAMTLYDQFEVNGEVVDDNVLVFPRVVSTWKGEQVDPDFDEYGSSILWALLDLDDLTDTIPSLPSR